MTKNTDMPTPEQDQKLDSGIRAAYIGGGFLLLSVVIAGIFGLWQGIFANPNPTATSVVVAPTATDEPKPTDIPANIPTNVILSTDTPTLTLTKTVISTLNAEIWSTECLERTSATVEVGRPTINGVINTDEWATWIDLSGDSTTSCGKYSIYDDSDTNTSYAAILVCDDDLSPPSNRYTKDDLDDLNLPRTDLTFDVVEIQVSNADPLLMVAPNLTGSIPNRVTVSTSNQLSDCLLIELRYRDVLPDSTLEITFHDVDSNGTITTLAANQQVQQQE